jgi:hypothetical protein
VIKAETVERRLRHEQLSQHGLEDYQQWVDNLLKSGQVSENEAEVLLQARSATERVVMVDDFTPEQLMNKDAAPKKAAAARKVATKKAAVKKKSAVKKKQVKGTTK